MLNKGAASLGQPVAFDSHMSFVDRIKKQASTVQNDETSPDFAQLLGSASNYMVSPNLFVSYCVE